MQENYNTLMHDVVFKESFANEHNRRQLESLLENLLSLSKGSLHGKLTVAYESQIGKNKIDEKASRTDIVIDYDDVVLDLEAYTYLDEASVDKSTFYVMKLSASRLVRGMKYEDLKVVQYNFVDHVNVNIGPDIINQFHLVHSKYPEIRIAEDKLNVNYIRIDKVRELGYNENELMKRLRFIAATSSEERIKVADGDKMFLDMNDWINNFVNSKEYKEYAKVHYADDIRRSLKENVPIQAICLYTGLSEEDIKEFSALD